MRKNLGIKSYLLPEPVAIIGTYNDDGSPNAMNAAWVSMAESNRISLYLSSGHKTVKNLLKRKAFTIGLANLEHLEDCDYVGLISGNKVTNKLDATSFEIEKSEFVDAPIIANLPITFELKVFSYHEDTEHLVGEIINVSIDEKYIDENGQIDVEKMELLTYNSINLTYNLIGKKVGKAFSDGKKLGGNKWN